MIPRKQGDFKKIPLHSGRTYAILYEIHIPFGWHMSQRESLVCTVMEATSERPRGFLLVAFLRLRRQIEAFVRGLIRQLWELNRLGKKMSIIRRLIGIGLLEKIQTQTKEEIQMAETLNAYHTGLGDMLEEFYDIVSQHSSFISSSIDRESVYED